MENEEMKHCKDCCCARAWEALGVNEFDGKNIVEHITQLRADKAELWNALDDVLNIGALDTLDFPVAEAIHKKHTPAPPFSKTMINEFGPAGEATS